MTDIGARFRALHEADDIFLIPNPWDAGSARMLTSLGFQALATTSSGFAAAIGKGDGATTREEALANCRAIAAATPLPVNGDLEQGYGDRPEDAAETVHLAAEAGLAGCSIEDYSGTVIYDLGLAKERVAAAVEAARGLPADFMLTARAENLIRGRQDMDDTVKRLQAYESLGADVLYAPGLRNLNQVRLVTGSTSKPVNVLIGGTTDMTVPALAEAGVKRISVGGALTWVAYGAMIKAARGMLDEGRFDYGDTPGMQGIATLLDARANDHSGQRSTFDLGADRPKADAKGQRS
ncbi:MAG: isocitrate lyase/PEP mutase family protein [Geminicoccales bacterium]